MVTAELAPGLGDPAPSLFFSYSRTDQKRAKPIIAAFEDAGFKVWWDGLLEGGENYLPTTETALETANVVVALWSKTSIDSHWVRDEATRGRERGVLVPLSLDGSQAPLGFRQFQVIDLAKWRGRADAPEIQAAIRAARSLAGTQIDRLELRPNRRLSRRAAVLGAASVAAGAAITVGLFKHFGSASGTDSAIAVLPFSSIGDASQSYFSEGLSEELRATLSRNPMLRIVAPTSSGEFRGATDDALMIARKLKVGYVLRGSVRFAAEQLRVAVELIKGSDASVVWTKALDRRKDDVLALQSEIAAIVAGALAVEINSQAIASGRSGDWLQVGGTKDVAAFDAYLRGKALADSSKDEDSDRAALALFNRSIGRDPDYGSALAARSKMLAVIANETGRSNEIRGLYDQAIEAAQAAIRTAPKLAVAYSALGYALHNGRLDPRSARTPYDRSVELGPGDADVLRAYALFCAFTARAADASGAIETSLGLDPLNPGTFRAAGYIALARHDFSQTIVSMRQALTLNPELSAANSAMGTALYLSGQTAEAKAAFAAEPLELFRLQGEAIVQHKIGDAAGAQRAFEAMFAQFGSNSGYQQAQVLAQWDQRDTALELLEKAGAARDSGMLLAPTDPLLDPLRGSPRFAQLLSGMGLA